MKPNPLIEMNISRALWPWRMSNLVCVFAVLAAALLFGVGALSKAAFSAPLVPVCLFLLISVLCLRGLVQSYPHDRFGACNMVTLGRAGLVSVMAGAIFAPAAPWHVFLIAVLALATDGLDGWLARRAGLSSAFGARFDMEMDALLGAVLALVLLTHGTVGPAVLVLGFSRYVFVLAGLVWPALQGTLPESYRRKAICVIQIAALILLVLPLTPPMAAPFIAALAAGLLVYSFGVDAMALMRATV